VTILRTLAAALAIATFAPVASAQQAQLVSTIAGADRAGPWGNSSYDFSLKVSKSIFKTINSAISPPMAATCKPASKKPMSINSPRSPRIFGPPRVRSPGSMRKPCAALSLTG